MINMVIKLFWDMTKILVNLTFMLIILMKDSPIILSMSFIA